jgi:hypothetical protein
MKHPKARNELPEQVKARVEEARRKLKKSSGTLMESVEACEHDGGVVTTCAAPVAFPAFPELRLTILKRSGRGETYNCPEVRSAATA